MHRKVKYLRDQVEIDAFWEYDNKIIIDEELGEQLTKEGQKRFKKYFAPKVIAKKLGRSLNFNISKSVSTFYFTRDFTDLFKHFKVSLSYCWRLTKKKKGLV